MKNVSEKAVVTLAIIMIPISLVALFLKISSAMNKPVTPEPPAINSIGNARFGEANVQFTEVTGRRVVCMVALHTQSGNAALYAVMECVPK